jgi:hypothetical protein
MMDTRNDKELIEKYRKSDFGDRIFLFLDHRDLRSEFSAIDTADAERNNEQSAEKQNPHIFKPDWLSSMKRVWQEIFSTSKPSSESVE